MLNTSLHNPNVKDKTPFERFVSINKGIDNGEDLPEELLKVRRPPIFSSIPLFSLVWGPLRIKGPQVSVSYRPTDLLPYKGKGCERKEGSMYKSKAGKCGNCFGEGLHTRLLMRTWSKRDGAEDIQGPAVSV